MLEKEMYIHKLSKILHKSMRACHFQFVKFMRVSFYKLLIFTRKYRVVISFKFKGCIKFNG